MEILVGFLYVLLVLCALMLILLVLFRPSEGSGLAGAFGGMGSDNVFGARATQLIDKIISVVAFVFIATALALGVIDSHSSSSASEDDSSSAVAPMEPTQAEAGNVVAQATGREMVVVTRQNG